MDNLILHFDINGTITIMDSTEHLTGCDLINTILSKNIYGCINGNIWTVSSDPTAHTPASITYFEYMKLVNPTDYQTKCLDVMRHIEPKYYYLIDGLKKAIDSNIILFESFIRVLEQFHMKSKIVFRTFGNDIDLIREELMNRHNINVVHLGDVPTIDCLNEQIFGTANHLAIRDDYMHWKNNNKDQKSGKPIVGHDSVIQFFFDDLSCVNIVNSTGCNVFKINTLLALSDPNYYVDMINARIICNNLLVDI